MCGVEASFPVLCSLPFFFLASILRLYGSLDKQQGLNGGFERFPFKALLEYAEPRASPGPG